VLVTAGLGNDVTSGRREKNLHTRKCLSPKGFLSRNFMYVLGKPTETGLPVTVANFPCCKIVDDVFRGQLFFTGDAIYPAGNYKRKK
jgi:hypothetical protein